MTQQIVLISGALFGGLAVIFGAFGAHALKKILSETQLKSFETGVKYQMYHAIVLLFVGSSFSNPNQFMSWSFIIGVFLFSFSIYGLILSDAKGKKMKFLGTITPLGGLFLVIGWVMLLLEFI
ncbi:DUF423 domain-containing protein [Tenacibaculum retecalamus]|uniref:DUF423 domain-containing protein n=1 Tax=Tenacibaculum retecalamus TaxID=3018315 RepID=UPI0023D90602|nr:DUF423 domain-containing protein [Tenacibaculum retecalamus]WBX71629.1 DUF423 domain-containing protein [Tenacibaculum retecalamus]